MLVIAFDLTGAEECNVHAERFSEVLKAEDSVRGCLSWDIICYKGTTASLKAHNRFQIHNKGHFYC